MKQYIVYQTVNHINGNIYVGVHGTENPYDFDGYLGSGYLLEKAVRRYGKDAFERHVLHVFNERDDAYQKEAEIVCEEFVQRPDTYNLTTGGSVPPDLTGRKHTPEQIQKRIDARKGIPMAEATKEKLRQYSGERASSFGTIWITDGNQTKKISKNDPIPDGWMRGRSNVFSQKQKSLAKTRMNKRFEDDSMRQRWSEMMSGKNNPRYGKKTSSKTREMISTKAKERYADDEFKSKFSKIFEEKSTCPHCGKTGSKIRMSRWHFDNCKKKE